MDLVNIKKELLKLEKQNESILKEIRNIYEEIDTANKDKDEYNYSEIKNLSCHVKLESHPLSELDDQYLKEIYIRMILEFVKLNKNQSCKKKMLIYVQWVLNAINLNIELSELLTKKRFEFEDLVKEVVESISEEYREILFFDLILVSSLSENKEELYTSLVDFSSILGVSDDKIIKLLDISKYILTKEISNNLDMKYMFEKYNKYMFKEEKEELISSKREIVYIVKTRNRLEGTKDEIKEKKYFSKGERIAKIPVFGGLLNNIQYSYYIVMPYSGLVYKYTEDVGENGEQIIAYIISTEYDNINDINKYVKAGITSGKIKVDKSLYSSNIEKVSIHSSR